MGRSASLYEALDEQFGSTVAAYAVTLAHRVRYSVQMNAREAMHMLELRTTPRGPPRVPQGVPEDAPADRRTRPGTGRSPP